MYCIKRLIHLAGSKPVHTGLVSVCKRVTCVIQNISLRSQHNSNEIENDEIDEAYNELSNEYLGIVAGGHRAFIVQPYIKWGPDKKRNTTPELQLAEAEALVKTLPHWTIVDKVCIPLTSLEKKQLLGEGGLENLKTRIRSQRNVTAIFISTYGLKYVQIRELQTIFSLPIYDRYSIVIQIFHQHAKSREAKLQVALAEIPYIWKKLNVDESRNDGAINFIDSRRKILQARETKLKNEIKKLKQHRQMLRSSRQKLGIPSVAIVGYTNAGKTSLIKALTGDSSLEPRNQLFATLDTTAYEGRLPSTLKVLYMDTIGFIQDIPATLLEPFVATFEDAMTADVIVHIYDASHPDYKAQYTHVQETLKNLIHDDRPIINVANKCDLVKQGTVPEDVLAISATESTGIDLLRQQIEKELLLVTGRSTTRIRVRSGSPEAAWLYKETVVVGAEPDSEDLQYLIMSVIATEDKLRKFKKFLSQ
ncbi:putative GTP-binding protein 6 [Orussus abietinus]|uniref:putative GTP-binding protein 6 n=1 Tax=Orussus abietinus TaxID=222816 RepID=UPI000626B601|nr:putative GTP-binding protein 6 [Orussus abietinus]